MLDLVRSPVADGPTVTVKLDVNTMTDISHPLTFPVITTTICMGAKCFSFCCFSLQGERNHALLPPLPLGGSRRSPTLIFILVTLGRAQCALGGFSFLFS